MKQSHTATRAVIYETLLHKHGFMDGVARDIADSLVRALSSATPAPMIRSDAELMKAACAADSGRPSAANKPAAYAAACGVVSDVLHQYEVGDVHYCSLAYAVVDALSTSPESPWKDPATCGERYAVAAQLNEARKQLDKVRAQLVDEKYRADLLQKERDHYWKDACELRRAHEQKSHPFDGDLDDARRLMVKRIDEERMKVAAEMSRADMAEARAAGATQRATLLQQERDRYRQEAQELRRGTRDMMANVVAGVLWETDKVPLTRFPWMHPALSGAGWSLASCNHYRQLLLPSDACKTRCLFVVMTKDGRAITAEGPDEEVVFKHLVNRAEQSDATYLKTLHNDKQP